MKFKNSLIIATVLLFALSLSGCYITKKSTEYYGIDIKNTKKMVFLVDISGSMEGNAETDAQGKVLQEAVSITGKQVNKIVGGGIVGNTIQKQTNNQLTKLGKAKKELIPAIRGLSEDTYFNIIIFENDVKTMRSELIQATSANKSIAIAYLENLKSGGGTNISDAIQKAFDFAGTGATDASQQLEVDAIFLLSDGEPTAGAFTATNDIMDAVNKWNSSKRVVINTIGLGEDCDKDFMQLLAKSNNGMFIDK